MSGTRCNYVKFLLLQHNEGKRLLFLLPIVQELIVSQHLEARKISYKHLSEVRFIETIPVS